MPIAHKPKRIYTYDDCDFFIRKAARRCSRMHDMYDYDDAYQDGWEWVIANKDTVIEFLAAEPQRTTRLYWAIAEHMDKVAAAFSRDRQAGMDYYGQWVDGE